MSKEEELKTLKEICWENKIGLRDYSKLKQEAIKWVKHSDKVANDPESAQDELRDFWMERFNITEKDLE